MDNDALRQKYNPDGSNLRNHQLRMLDILITVDKICKEHHLTYWIASGTLLGAVRHGGFIPWDDDLDIEMPTADFKKFLQVVPAALPKHLAIQTHQTDRGYVAPYAKVRDLNSEIQENEYQDVNYKYKGIYIDVFPMGHCSMALSGFSSKYPHYYLYKFTRKKFTGKLDYFLLHSYYTLLQVVYGGFSLIDKLMGIKYINYVYGSGFWSEFPSTCIYPLSEIEFEGHSFPCPHDQKEYLTIIYGDYMSLPPENDRMTHTLKVVMK